MRKIFVVLLVLAIAGGALAQEAEVAKEGSNWGTLTGEGKISTTVDFYGPDEYDGKAWIYGGQADDMFIKLFWDFKKGDWTVALPFTISTDDTRGWYFSTDDDDDDTYSGIKYNPNGGPLTLELPFSMTFSEKGTIFDEDQPLTLFDTIAEVGAGAIYDGGNYWFKVAFDKITSADIAPGAIGGWYDFGENGSRLAVSYNGATDSEWWRASDIVLGAGPKFGSYAWENIGGDYSNYGLAYKFGISKDFNLGISFAGDLGNGEAGQAIFGSIATGPSPSIPDGADPDDYNIPSYNWNFVNDFLGNFIVGMKYDGAVAISLMAGMWTKPVFDGHGDWVYDNTESKWNWVPSKELDFDIGIPLHLGAAWENKDLGISVKGDVSALFDKQYDLYDKNGKKYEKIGAWFNLGLQAQYGDSDATDGFWARLLLKGIDLADNKDFITADRSKGVFAQETVSKTNDEKIGGRENDDQVFSTELWVGYQRNVNDDNDGWDKFDGKGTGLWAALYAAFPDFTATKFRLDTKLGIGYAGLPIIADKLLFNIGATVGLNVNPMADVSITDDPWYMFMKKNNGDDLAVNGSFDISPELEWKLIENGSAVFNYTIGMNDFYKGALDINKFTASFKYTF